MSQCDLCEHAKIEGINEGLRAQLPFAVIAARFHVPMKLIALHQAHRISEMQDIPIITIDRDAGEAILASGARVPTQSISIDEMRGHTPRVVLEEMRVEPESTIFPCQPDPLPEGLRRLVAFVEATEASTVPADPIRLVKHHVTEAARIWWNEVEEDRRSDERLQLILAEAFADPNLGLP